MSECAGRSRTLVFALVGAIAAVVIIAIVVVFARGGPATYDAGTPEGVVQRYSQAVIDGDIPEAMDYLAPEVVDDCERMPVGTEDRRVTLLQTTEHDDTARVEVLVATVYGTGPLGTSEYETEAAFDLERVDGAWLIVTTPWELAVCYDTGAG